MHNDKQQHDKPKVEWVHATEFVAGNLIVIVKKLPVNRPKFSIEVSYKLDSNGTTKNVRFIPLRTTGQGKIQVETVSQDLVKLMQQAEEYVLNEAQKAEDIYIAYKIVREQRWMNKGKPETRTTGKTQREREKRKQKPQAQA